MASPETATPATACSEPALNFEQLGGELDDNNTEPRLERQAQRLRRMFGLSFSAAAVIASLAWGIVR
ncbi:hypothetical protein [Bradyrhizobium huanghuaihaiense]|uniref:hypothetical protein n=1 Tax=Bradyrhizobium huanghuaihaiense TaxID=990078 RepID=UPI0011A34AF8|nr:hypothetical protein [Bradyrhizobium huanghuaihaiense]